MIDAYHVTVLSNFARGYDKYRRAYDKAAIAESTYPGEFYVLAPDELAIGVTKAQRLLERLALPGDRLIALHARLPDAQLRPNARSGLGRVWPSGTLPIHAVHDVIVDEDAVRLRALRLEDAAADALAVLQPTLRPFPSLTPRTVSLLPVARGCQAACPFCFSEASVSASQTQGTLSLERVRAVLGAGRARGATRAVITGGGEPGLLAQARLLELVAACASELPKVVLITNGASHARLPDDARVMALHALRQAGLTVLNLSRHHADREQNASLMRFDTGSERVIASWRGAREALAGLQLRVTCVLQRGGVQDAEDVRSYLRWAASLGVSEVCFKELYVSTSRESVFHSYASNDWSAHNQVPLSVVLEVMGADGFVETARLPWGSPVFRGSVDGQPMQVAAYTEPSVWWERTHGLARSWNLMADGSCLASLEDKSSVVEPVAA